MQTARLLVLALAAGAAQLSAGTTDILFGNSQGTPASGVQLILNGGSYTFDAAGRGWIDASGQNNYGVSTPNNFGVGHCAPPYCPLEQDYRNYFFFNLTDAVLPTITSATLRLYLQSDGLYTSNPSVTLQLFDVSNWSALLVNSGGQTANFADLGSGIMYGSRVYTSADVGTTADIALNAAAVTALNGPFDGTRGFAIGGSVLAVSSVPEPATWVLLTAGVGALALLRRRRA